MAINAMVIIAILSVRQVNIVLEQPASSQLWKTWCYKKWIERFSAIRVHTWMRAFSHELAKPTILYCLLQNAESLKRIWSPQREQMKTELGDEAFMTGTKIPACPGIKTNASEYYTESADGRVQGCKKLSESASYTEAFAKAIFDLHGAADLLEVQNFEVAAYVQVLTDLGLFDDEAASPYITFLSEKSKNDGLKQMTLDEMFRTSKKTRV
jgi:hypothetical protein